jgi:hypothetical protein
MSAISSRLTQVGHSWVAVISGAKYRVAQFTCSCGAVVTRRVSKVKTGGLLSCGCYDRERRVTQGGWSKSRVYNCWISMIARCETETHRCYPIYGGRGIRVCDRWHTFAAFLEDMGEPPTASHTLDRYPNKDGNYEPGNVRWATKSEQRRNSNQPLLFLTIDGETLPAVDWSMRAGAAVYDTILSRKKRGWSDRDAVFAPKQTGGPATKYGGGKR